MNKGNNRLLAVLILLIALTVGLAIGNTYIYLSRVKEIQNSLIALQNSKSAPGPIGLSGLNGLRGETGLQGPTGPQGIQGVQGIVGDQGLQGIQGQKGDPGGTGPQGLQGEKGDQGDPGANGREVEFRCNPANNNYEYRYVGEEGWIIIQRDSNACKSTPV